MAANLLHGQAIAMQYASFLLHRVAATASGRQALDSLLADVRDCRGGSVVDHTVLGCIWTTNIVTALAVEMALKSLLQAAVGEFSRTHDLLELFDALPPDLANDLRETHRRLSVSGVPLRDLLELHRHDFVGWRYLDEKVEVLAADFQELQLAVSAILEHLGSE